MALTEAKARNAKAGVKPYKLTDENGLQLWISPTGHKSWRLRCQHDGKEAVQVLGAYPEMSLRAARDLRDDLRSSIRNGHIVIGRSATFYEMAKQWHTKWLKKWKPSHARDIWRRLEADILPALANRPINQIQGPELLALLYKIEQRSPEVAHRVRAYCQHIWAFAYGLNEVTANPAQMIAGNLEVVTGQGHRPAVRTLMEAQHVMRVTEALPAYPIARLALRFIALTVVRPGEAIGTRWEEITDSVWKIPAERMKMKRKHWVPLTPQALEVLQAASTYSQRSEFVFPALGSLRDTVDVSTLNRMLRRAGFAGIHCPHGWRGTFTTIMNEQFRQDSDVIELMLSHVQTNRVKRAYDHAEHLERRRELATIWADMLMKGMPPATQLLELPRAA